MNKNSRYVELILERTVALVERKKPLSSGLQTLLKQPEFKRGSNLAAKWRQLLSFLVGDLQDGVSLSHAFGRRIEPYLPEYAVPAIEEAEKADQVCDVLHTVLNSMKAQADMRRRSRAAIQYPLLQFGFIVVFSTGFAIFILPKLMMILQEYSWVRHFTETTSPLGQIGLAVLTALGHPSLFLLLLWLALAAAVMAVVRRVESSSRIYSYRIGKFHMLIPFLSRYRHHVRVMECAELMALYLASGKDVLTAAEFSSKTAKDVIITRKLKRFATSIRNGVNWAEAWQQLSFNVPLVDFILANAQTLERAPTGLSNSRRMAGT